MHISRKHQLSCVFVQYTKWSSNKKHPVSALPVDFVQVESPVEVEGQCFRVAHAL